MDQLSPAGTEGWVPLLETCLETARLLSAAGPVRVVVSIPLDEPSLGPCLAATAAALGSEWQVETAAEAGCCYVTVRLESR